MLEEGEALAEAAMKLASVCEKGDLLPQARAGLERALRSDGANVAVRERLREVYEKTGAFAELGAMSLAEARAAADDDVKFTQLVRGSAILLQHGIDARQAQGALLEAHALRPTDVEAAALLADAHTALEELPSAEQVLQTTLAAHRGRRSRDLAVLHHRMARIERARGNVKTEIGWLSSALDMDGQNGNVASELAQRALEQGQYDLATKGLRAITMLKTPAPLPRALAYQRLGEIAHHQGDVKKAMLLLKRAVDDDPTLESARTLLTSLQAQ